MVYGKFGSIKINHTCCGWHQTDRACPLGHLRGHPDNGNFGIGAADRGNRSQLEVVLAAGEESTWADHFSHCWVGGGNEENSIDTVALMLDAQVLALQELESRRGRRREPTGARDRSS